MAKISKNLKKLRAEKNFTQETLAEKMNISRQAISNWENDKTQPDIESLETLANIFGVDVEEIIYGKKRQVGEHPDKEQAKTKIRIILAIIGSLFLGLGLVLIFVNFWQDFPMIVKTILSVVPILAGQAFAVYVLKEREDETIWKESAATIWFVGCIATVALINSVFEIHCGYKMCLFIDILLCLPIFWILDAVSPIIVYYGMVINWLSMYPTTVSIPISLVLFLAAVLFVAAHRKKSEDVRYKYLLWITAIATMIYAFVFFGLFMMSPIFIASVFIMYYAAAGDDYDLSKPWKPIGAIGTMAFLSSCSVQSMSILFSRYYSSFHTEPNFDFAKSVLFIISAVAAGLMITAGLIVGRKSFKGNLLRTLLTVVSILGLVFAFLLLGTESKIISVLIILLACAFGVLLIIKGVRELHFLAVNLGLITVFIQIADLLGVIGDNILFIGVAFVIFGALLIAVNIKLSAEKKLSAATESIVKEEDAL